MNTVITAIPMPILYMFYQLKHGMAKYSIFNYPL